MTKKKTFKIELNEVELYCLLKYRDIRYYGGQYDLRYDVPKGFNWDTEIEDGIRLAFKKIARQARKRWKIASRKN